MYESGWVVLRGFFNPIHHCELKIKNKNKNKKATHMDQIGSMDWINFFLTTIIIKLSIRTIPNQHKLFEKNLSFEFYLGGGWVDQAEL